MAKQVRYLQDPKTGRLAGSTPTGGQTPPAAADDTPHLPDNTTVSLGERETIGLAGRFRQVVAEKNDCPTCGAQRTPQPAPGDSGLLTLTPKPAPVPPRDIGVDLDGVMYNFAGALSRYAEQRGLFGPGDTPDHDEDVDSYNFWKDEWGWQLSQFMEVTREGIEAGHVFRRGDPYPDAVAGFQAMQAAGHRLHVITDRRWPGAEDEAEQSTRDWLEQNGIRPDSITFTKDKTAILDVAENPDTAAFIEDLAKNAEALDQAGVETWLVDRPWNRHYATPRRMPSMGEFSERIVAGRCACG